MGMSQEQLTREFLKELYDEHVKDPSPAHVLQFDDVWARVTGRHPKVESNFASAAFNALYAGQWINQWNGTDGKKTIQISENGISAYKAILASDKTEKKERFGRRLALFGAAVGLCSFVLGAISNSIWTRPSIPGQWYQLAPGFVGYGPGGFLDSKSKDRVPVSYADTMFDSDLPSLVIQSIEGKAKFVAHAESDGKVPIGYVISEVTASMDKSHVPEKYKKERVIQMKGGPITALPIEQAAYEVEFVFRLLDRDGFELMSVTSKPHTVLSGATSNIQWETEPAVPIRMASLTDRVEFHTVVTKCLTSDTGSGEAH
jgi:hypothetical protein